MHICVPCVCRAMPSICRGQEKGVKSPETGAMDDGELLCGCQELSLGPLEEQPVRLITELLLQVIEYSFYNQ